MSTTEWLPALLAFNGDWQSYVEEVYTAFRADFITSRPTFRGRPLGLKRHPDPDGKGATFWHLTSEGPDEENRTPDLRRCERIRWIRPMIEEAWRSKHVYVWENERKGRTRWVIALHDFQYVVVLEDHKKYLLPWTAYAVEQEHRRNKLEKEYLAAFERQKPPPQTG